jgi:hypothetical protein
MNYLVFRINDGEIIGRTKTVYFQINKLITEMLARLDLISVIDNRLYKTDIMNGGG